MPQITRLLTLPEFRETYASPFESLEDTINNYIDTMIAILEAKKKNKINKVTEIE